MDVMHSLGFQLGNRALDLSILWEYTSGGMANMNQQMLIYSPNQVLTCYTEPKIARTKLCMTNKYHYNTQGQIPHPNPKIYRPFP